MKEKIQTAIYRIDKTLFETSKNHTEIATEIVNKCNEGLDEISQFKIQALKENNSNKDFKISIYYSENNSIPYWRNFIGDLLQSEEPLIKGQNNIVSFIAFITTVSNMYAITGGLSAYFAIHNYIDPNFGLEIISRLISRNSRVIRELQERGFVGAILGSTKFFREKYSLADEDEFGKFYKKVKAEIDKDTLINEFGFSSDEIKKQTGCIAKASFQINKTIDLNQLLKILTKINIVFRRKPKFSVNNVIAITKRTEKEKKLIDTLNNEFLSDIYNHVKNSKCHLLDYDLCNKEFEKYLTASIFRIYRGLRVNHDLEYEELNNTGFLFDELKDNNLIVLDSLDTFSDSIQSINIESYDSNGDVNTKRTPLLEHIHGEINFNNSTYFYFEGNWYEIKKDYLKELDNSCKEIINSEILQNSLLPISYSDCDEEQKYIEKYFGKNSYIVMHKIKHENFELCDLIKYDDQNIYLIHIKQGFTNSIRDLSSQVMLSAQRVYEDIKSNPPYTYLKGVYDAVNRCKKSNERYFKKIYTQPILKSCDTFVKLFNKRIYNCFAFVDTAITSRDITDINKFKSNIAKCSLLNLHHSMRGKNWGFRIIQIIK